MISALAISPCIRNTILNWVKQDLSARDYNILIDNFDLLVSKYGQQETTLYRGLHFDTEDELREFLTEDYPIYWTSHLTSWTTSLTTADKFGARWPAQCSVILETHIEPRVGISLAEWKTLPYEEQEVILPAGDYRVSLLDVTGLPDYEIFDLLGEDYERSRTSI